MITEEYVIHLTQGIQELYEINRALTADFALQVQRTDEQRAAYEQALQIMEADFRKYEGAWMTAEGKLADAEARIEALTAERVQWIQHTRNAVWADSEELKQAETDNARLRAVLDLDPWFVGRAAWKKYTDIALKGETP